MTNKGFTSPDELWDAILSRESNRILIAWQRLNAEEQVSLLAHLERMITEDGWHPEQITSAQTALNIIRKATDGDIVPAKKI
jgi:hypothetical protein